MKHLQFACYFQHLRCVVILALQIVTNKLQLITREIEDTMLPWLTHMDGSFLSQPDWMTIAFEITPKDTFH
jgi:hypothetical protein